MNRVFLMMVSMILLAAFGVACSSDATDPSPQGPEAQSRVVTDYSIKVWVEHGDSRTLVKFGPVDGALSKGGNEGSSTQVRSGPSWSPGLNSRANSTVEDEDGGVIHEGDSTEEELATGKQPGWGLLRAALSQCSGEIKSGWGNSYAEAPWMNENYWFFFPSGPIENSCDANLKAQEILACAAAKLAQISETVGNITWDNVYMRVPGSNWNAVDRVRWIIPPQAKRDQFVLRDLAINTLAHVALLGHESSLMDPPTPAFFQQNDVKTCSDFFRTMSETPQPLPNVRMYYEPKDPSDPAFGGTRLRIQANVLRSSGQLLRDLLDKSFYADLAGAESNRSLAGDPARGTELMWGVRDGEDGSYNSLRHIMRLLFGRWELGPNYEKATTKLQEPCDSVTGSDDLSCELAGCMCNPDNHVCTSKVPDGACDCVCQTESDCYCFYDAPLDPPPEVDPRLPHQDPKCRGFSALELLRRESDKKSLLTPGFSARWTDREVSTTGQSLAYSTLLGAGIVVPPSSYDDDENWEDIRAGIEEQLLLDAANAQRPEDDPWYDFASPEFQNFKDRPGGKTVSEVFQGITDADLKFALGRVFGQFRLLTDTAQTLTQIQGTPGARFRPANEVSDRLVGSPVFGGVLVGGFPSYDLIADPLARLSGARIGSQCKPFGPENRPAKWWGQVANDVYAPFQNVFLLGDTLRLQLEQIASKTEDLPDVEELASLGSAELRTWTGPGRIIVRWLSNSTFAVRLVGIEPSDIGADSPASMADRLAVVYGEPWKADCLAGLRDSCPQSIPYLRRTGFEPKSSQLDGFAETEGHYGRMYEWTFEWPSEVGAGLVKYAGDVHVVVRPTGIGAQPKGRVIASFFANCDRKQDGCARNHVSDTLSTYQRDLATKAFQVGARWPEYGNELGEDSTSVPGAYCLKGVSRNFFVNLENELNSDNDQFEDSWKHYLDMAEAASARADSLARDLIDLGKESDLRREAAGFELAQECGNFSVIGGLGAAEGELVLPDDDGQLASCLAPETVDLVFTIADPYPGLSNSQELEKIRKEILLCETEDAHALCGKPDLTWDSLGVEPMPPLLDNDEWRGCEAIEDVASSRSFQEPKLHGHRLSDYMSAPRLLELLGALHLQFDIEGDWRLTLLDRILMSTYEADSIEVEGSAELYYPACACQTAACDPGGCVGEAAHWAKIFPTIASAQYGAPQQKFEVGLMVQRGLWAMAGRAGKLPAGRISMPIPAANATEPWFDANQDLPLPVQIVYGWSRFGQVDTDGEAFKLETGGDLSDIPDQSKPPSGAPLSGPNGPFADDRSYLGTGRPMRTGPARWIQASRVVVPNWLRNVAGLAAETSNGAESREFLTVYATNEDVEFGADDPERWLRHVMDSCGNGGAGFSSGTHMGTDPLAEGLIAKGFVCSTFQVLDHYGQGGLGWYMQGRLRHRGNDAPQEWVSGAPASIFEVPKLPGIEARFSDFVPRAVLPDPAVSATFARPSGWEPFWSADAWESPCAAGLTMECLVDWERAIWYSSDPENLQSYKIGAQYHLPRKSTLPTVCSPDSRLSLFLSHGFGDEGLPEDVDCSTPAEMVTQMMGMACLGTEKLRDAANAPSPPPIESEADIALFQAWLTRQSWLTNAASAGQIFEGIPRDVVSSMKPGATNAVEASGRQGQLHYELQRSIEQLSQAWRSAQSQFSKLASLLDLLRADIRLATIAGRRELIANDLSELSLENQGLGLEAELIELDRQASMQSVQSMQRSFAMVTGVAVGAAKASAGGGVPIPSQNPPPGGDTNYITSMSGYGDIANSIGQWYFGKKADEINTQSRDRQRENIGARRQNITSSLDLLLDDEELIVEQTGTTIERAFAQYAVSTVPIYEQLDAAVSQINLSANEVRSKLLALAQMKNNAAYYAAGAAGADYFTDANGEIVKLPVNTVLRRQYDVTRLRYEQGLNDAKRLAYMARLAIEQRIAMRLGDINEPVGSLEAPRLWADKVCSLQGVDYKALRSYDETSTSAEEQALVSQFADEYIGDYVARLRTFMEFYSVAYPFHEGDDIAVLSVRDELMQSEGVCLGDARNMLLYSDQLWKRGQEGFGWAQRSCEADSTKCVIASPPGVLAGEEGAWSTPTPPYGFGGVTWIHDVEGDGALPSADAPLVSEPDGFVYQSVYLTANTPYVLSWWDMMRGPNGGPPDIDGPLQPGGDVRYLVSVYDADWELMAQAMPAPYFVAEGPSDEPDYQSWSPRRGLGFTVPSDGWFRIAFRASLRGALNGSVAIANVQLEDQAVGTVGAGPYVSTLATRQTLSGECAQGRAEDFRAGFDHRCDVDGSCYYELRHPFIIDTRQVNDLTSKLVGKVAAGNYNFRHVDVALNVVGTAVLNCQDQGSSCYADGYLEYGLGHDAFRAILDDYSGTSHGFNFGSAGIRRGKALATERWITNPISSADMGVLSQPQFTKVELRGRPLSGTYRLRVYDRASLDWERVEDIQIVLKYRYWSRIQEGTSN